ncbi:MAG: hypothetical protein Q7J78_06280, partial [Clostridiales bacterium]|nr:hypothetical protein [Clostridiales bacterium]
VIAYRVLPSDDAIWNYALCIDSQKPANSFMPVKLPVEEGCRPWEKAPLGLKVMAKKVLNWKIDGEPSHPLTPGLPYNPMKLSEEETEIVLVPFGFTHLRMTYIPCIME